MTKLLLRGGCVLTLGAKSPNLREGDVLVEDGRIAEVGTGIRARDAEPIDASETIVMPGFVDTHRHVWTSLFRNAGDNPPGWNPLATRDRLGADDVYASTLVGLLGAIEAGITTVVDWSDLPPTDAALEAALQAHADAGLRTVFMLAPDPADGRPRGPWIERLAEAAGPATTVGLGVDGGPAVEAWSAAREAGAPIHVHAGPELAAPGAIAALAARGPLGADVTLVHCRARTDADLEALRVSGASVSLAPSSEMANGLGSPALQELIDRDIRPALGVDDERLAPGDMFAPMRELISIQHATVFDRKLAGKGALPRLMSTRDVIRHATVDGARVAGLAGVTGSLEPGRQADLIVLRTDRPNVFPVNDPIGAVVWGMDTSNLHWVIAGGRILMREGALEADVRRARDLAERAWRRVAEVPGPVGALPRIEA